MNPQFQPEQQQQQQQRYSWDEATEEQQLREAISRSLSDDQEIFGTSLTPQHPPPQTLTPSRPTSYAHPPQRFFTSNSYDLVIEGNLNGDNRSPRNFSYENEMRVRSTDSSGSKRRISPQHNYDRMEDGGAGRDDEY